MRDCSYREAILEATTQLMERDQNVYVIGLGATDPKGIFGTTLGLVEKFGSKRVFDMPVSENALTGIAIGSSLMGMKPIMTHQRVDFSLLALDQLVNNAAKWHYMFGGQMKVSLVIRLIMGRGWGQGPQHAQTLHSWFAHVPGLKVLMPSTPCDAKGLLIAAVQANAPVIFMEHRWLHQMHGPVPEEFYTTEIGKARILKQGEEVSILACSHMALEAFKAATLLEKEGISVEVIDLRTIKPFDKECILTSARKTKRVVIADPDWKTGGFAAEISAFLVEEVFDVLESPPRRITYPDRFTPTSWALANHYYPNHYDIAAEVLQLLGKRNKSYLVALLEEKMHKPLDVPDSTFTGPF